MVALGGRTNTGDRPSFLARLHAWWEGYELDFADAPRDGEPMFEEPEVTPGLKPEDVEGWTPERVQAAQRVLGHGLLMPGGEAYIERLITPLGMNESMSILEYGAKIGSATRVVARETGAWVYGFEPNAVLVEAADRISTQAGLAKKAAVESTLFEKSDIRDASRDAVLSFEALYTVEDKEALLATIKRFLKPRGQLLVTDFARAIDQDSSPDIEIWSAYERQPVHLAAADWYASHLDSLGFDVRVVEDTSAAYCHQIVQTLYAFSNSMTNAPVSPAFKPWILWEVECWAQRMALLQNGDVALYRVHAILK